METMRTVVRMDVTEVRECRSADEANSFLASGEWVVLSVKSEKIRRPVGKEVVGKDGVGTWVEYRVYDRYEIKYEESLEVVYVLGKKMA